MKYQKSFGLSLGRNPLQPLGWSECLAWLISANKPVKPVPFQAITPRWLAAAIL